MLFIYLLFITYSHLLFQGQTVPIKVCKKHIKYFENFILTNAYVLYMLLLLTYTSFSKLGLQTLLCIYPSSLPISTNEMKELSQITSATY